MTRTMWMISLLGGCALGYGGDPANMYETVPAKPYTEVGRITASPWLYGIDPSLARGTAAQRLVAKAQAQGADAVIDVSTRGGCPAGGWIAAMMMLPNCYPKATGIAVKWDHDAPAPAVATTDPEAAPLAVPAPTPSPAIGTRESSIGMAAGSGSTSSSSKLAHGFRGLPYGSDHVLAESPLEGCGRSAEAGVAWSCQTTVGEVPIEAHYMADESLFYGVMLMTEGYSNASMLLKSLQSAWGQGRTKEWATDSLADRLWMSGDVIGGFEYNQFSKKCSVTMFHRGMREQVQAAEKRRASEAAASDL